MGKPTCVYIDPKGVSDSWSNPGPPYSLTSYYASGTYDGLYANPVENKKGEYSVGIYIKELTSFNVKFYVDGKYIGTAKGKNTVNSWTQ
jgi:hypothetical protein